MGSGLTLIGQQAFLGCTELSGVVIPQTVTAIGSYAFQNCTALRTAHFKGNAPTADATVFSGTINMKVYLLPGTLDWSSTFGGSPTELWALPNPVILTCTGFGIQDQQFGFIVSWATNLSVAVDACSDLANTAWEPLGTNALVDGWFYFGDPGWANHSDRFYRTRRP